MNPKKLGFGLMRLPEKDGEIQIETVKQMADEFLAAGCDYFDTAYPYHNGRSETAFKEAVALRYPRESYRLADKLPVWTVNSPEDARRIFDEQKQRTGVEYFDNYLLHALSEDRIESAEKAGCFEFLKSVKDSGEAKHIGFSFHSTPEVLESLLAKYDFVEFVQLQINYIDWEDERVRAAECHEVARRYGKEVLIMEPVRGGSLAVLPDEVRSIFLSADKNRSIASWAVQFALSVEGLGVMLSGMTSVEQMRDNLATVSSCEPLSPEQSETIARVVKALRAIPQIPCTRCGYCVAGCPQEIRIPSVLGALNAYEMYKSLEKAREGYNFSRGKAAASDCIECGQCESACPQSIEIISHLKKAAQLFEG